MAENTPTESKGFSTGPKPKIFMGNSEIVDIHIKGFRESPQVKKLSEDGQKLAIEEELKRFSMQQDIGSKAQYLLNTIKDGKGGLIYANASGQETLRKYNEAARSNRGEFTINNLSIEVNGDVKFKFGSYGKETEVIMGKDGSLKLDGKNVEQSFVDENILGRNKKFVEIGVIQYANYTNLQKKFPDDSSSKFSSFRKAYPVK